MTPRPTSITVIGWIEIAFGIIGALGLIAKAALHHNPTMMLSLERYHVPASVEMMTNFVGTSATLACGIGLLNRQNWARYLYVGWSLVSFVFTAVLFKAYVLFFFVPTLVIFLVIVYFLFGAAATEYFTGKKAQEKV
jgi:hypothetical protein